MDQVIYLDPHAEVGAAQEPYTLRFLPKAGAIVGLFANMYTDSVAFLGDLVAPMGELMPGVTFKAFDKGNVRNMSFPAPPEFIATIAEACDAVVLGYGHCGSCTAGVANDAASLARAGRPVAALVTERFIEEARFLAQARGLPDMPYVFLPHPVAGQTADYRRALAAAIAPSIVGALTQGVQANCADALVRPDRVQLAV